LSDPEADIEGALITSRPLLRVKDRASLGEGLWNAYQAELVGAPRTDAPFFALANRVEIGGVSLHYCRYDSPVEIRFSSMNGVRQFQCLSGRGQVASSGRQVGIDPTATAIAPAGSSFDVTYGEGYQHIVSQFDEAALRRRAEAITGYSVPESLEFPFLQALPVGPRLRSREIVQSLGRILSATSGGVDIAIQEMGQALSSAFLIENMSGFSERVAKEPKPSGGASVKVLEDYIQANWNRPLTVEEIAAACGVSVRSVFARFKQQLGIAPLIYVRELRLAHARRMLLDDEEAMSVISIAMACGFASFGHFARRYREKFGELPSTTRARRALA
jgi:AraC-like DNA-binding protein